MKLPPDCSPGVEITLKFPGHDLTLQKCNAACQYDQWLVGHRGLFAGKFSCYFAFE